MGHAEWDRQNRTGRTGHAEEERQNRVGRRGIFTTLSTLSTLLNDQLRMRGWN
jgi:hypothetical protein